MMLYLDKIIVYNRSRKMFCKRICIDFDGVIHKYSKGFHDGTLYDEPMEGAKEYLCELKEDGYEIWIFTARLADLEFVKKNQNNPKEKIKEYLDKYDVPYDYITGSKVPAMAYIDDRGIEFKGDWNYVRDRLKECEQMVDSERVFSIKEDV
jgi:hypothetical protein